MTPRRLISFVVPVLLFAGCSEFPTLKSPEQEKPQSLSLVSPNPESARREIQRGALIIDVRSPEEFNRGHYPRAINVPYNLVSERQGAFGQEKSKSIVLYCESGYRAEVARQKLISLGYTNVVNGGGLEELGETVHN